MAKPIKENHETIKGSSLDRFVPMKNQVLVSIPFKNMESTTKAGVYKASVHMNQDQYCFDNVDRIFKVVKLPEVLDPGIWKTTMELQLGDIIWVSAREAFNSRAIIIDNIEYRLVDYYSIWIAKRGEEVIPVNGFCVCGYCYYEKESHLELDDKKKYSDLGVVKYVGKPTIGYLRNGKYRDRESRSIVKPGDKILLNKGFKPIALEGEKYKRFSDEDLFVVQRRSIDAIML